MEKEREREREGKLCASEWRREEKGYMHAHNPGPWQENAGYSSSEGEREREKKDLSKNKKFSTAEKNPLDKNSVSMTVASDLNRRDYRFSLRRPWVVS